MDNKEQIAREAAEKIMPHAYKYQFYAAPADITEIILSAMNRQGVSIALTRGKFAVVSPEDADLSLFDWHCTSHGRAAKGKSEYMHKIIGERMGLSGEIDHEDGNPLNNRRSNIRLCTRTQNQANTPKHPTRGNTSKYKGVCQRGDKWIAQIKQDGKVKHLGTFDNEDDAALAYDASAIMVFGEYARLNFPAAQPQRSVVNLTTDDAEGLCKMGDRDMGKHCGAVSSELQVKHEDWCDSVKYTDRQCTCGAQQDADMSSEPQEWDESAWQEQVKDFPEGLAQAIWHMPDRAMRRMKWLESQLAAQPHDWTVRHSGITRGYWEVLDANGKPLCDLPRFTADAVADAHNAELAAERRYTANANALSAEMEKRLLAAQAAIAKIKRLHSSYAMPIAMNQIWMVIRDIDLSALEAHDKELTDDAYDVGYISACKGEDERRKPLVEALERIRDEAIALVDARNLPNSVLHVEAPKRIKSRANAALASAKEG